MKINFGDYTYFNTAPNSSPLPYKVDEEGFARLDMLANGTGNEQLNFDRYKFDEDYFNSLIANRQYKDAVAYAKQYHFNDPEVDTQYKNYITDLERNGRILEAVYSRISDPDVLRQIEFQDAVFSDGGLERLNTTDESKENYNEYAVDFINYKNQLGGFGARSLSITFFPKEVSFIGIDWLAKDNTLNIDSFYKRSGLSEHDLRAAGVEIAHSDGNTTLKFDKSNQLANKIISSIAKLGSTNQYRSLLDDFSGNKDGVNIAGYDKRGNLLNEETYFSGNDIFGAINYLMYDTQLTKDEYFQEIGAQAKEYSSLVGPMLSDALIDLKNQLADGSINTTEYNRQLRILDSELTSEINGLGSANYEFYTNYYNDEDTDETLVNADDLERGELNNFISQAFSTGHVNVASMVSNGKIGTLLEIDAKAKDTDKFLLNKRVLIFIPGLLQNRAQERINSNTSTRAVQELNNMIDWGYDYKTEDGTVISIGQNGEFLKNNKQISKEDAVKEINRSMILEDALAGLQYQFVNTNNEMFDKAGYEQMARALSIRAVADLYPNLNVTTDTATGKTVFVDNYGRVYDVEDVFNNTLDERNTQYQVYKELQEVYAMYNRLMNEIAYYR